MTFSGSDHFHLHLLQEERLNSIFFLLKVPRWTGGETVEVLTVWNNSHTAGLSIQLVIEQIHATVTAQFQLGPASLVVIGGQITHGQYHRVEVMIAKYEVLLSVDDDRRSMPIPDRIISFQHIQLGKASSATPLVAHGNGRLRGWVKELYVNQWRPFDLYGNTTVKDQQLYMDKRFSLDVTARPGEHSLETAGIPGAGTSTADITLTGEPGKTESSSVPTCSPNDLDCWTPAPCEENEPCVSTSKSESDSSSGLGTGALVGIAVVAVIVVIPLMFLLILLIGKLAYRDSGEYKLAHPVRVAPLTDEKKKAWMPDTAA